MGTLLKSWVSSQTPAPGWYSKGRPTRSVNARTALVRGAYVPDAATTGPLIGSGWASDEGNSAGYIQMSVANFQCVGKTHWGEVRHLAPGIRHSNCRFAGADPNLMTSGAYGSSGGGGLVKSYGTGYYHWIAENCLFDPKLWVTERGRAGMTDANFVHQSAVWGGDFEMRWCRVRNTVDGVNWAQGGDLASDPANTGYNEGGFVSPAGERFTIIDRSVIEKCNYVNGPTYDARPGSQSGASPHNDAFQFATGHNCWIVGSVLGGPRDQVGYSTWPNSGSPGNTGSDFSNAALMIKQEGTTYAPTADEYIRNVMIEKCLLGGGVATVNCTLSLGNNLSGVTVRDCKFYQRQAGWGLAMSDGVLGSTNGGVGLYVAKGASPSSVLINWSGNTILETGDAVAFTVH